MQFEFATATKIIFGSGTINSFNEIAEGFGKNALIICGAPQGILEKLVDILNSHKINNSSVKINREPTVDVIQEVVDLARQAATDFIVAIGGGSAIDTGKATAALLTNPGELSDYLEIIGRKRPLVKPSMPLIAIPTTSGTGSEVTKNAVIGIPTHKVKVSLRSDFLLPRIALIDPELTINLPQWLTAVTGLDALTQLIEAFTCNSPNPMTDPLCLDGLQRVSRSLFQAYDDGHDLSAREDMSLASLFSGIALANAKLGAVHGLAGPLGGEIQAPHGAICASLLSGVLAENSKALKSRSPDHPSLERFTLISKLFGSESPATAENVIHWIDNFCQHAKIQPLSILGLSESQFDEIIEKARHSSSMKGNPITLSDDELRTILQRSLE
jgi:alcohol dehydrogenase class IV